MTFFSNIPKKERILHLSGILSALILIGIILNKQYQKNSHDRFEKQAITIMEDMINAVSGYCMDEGIETDPVIDPGRTGLIGPEWSVITTTIGHPEAKRTSTNPEFAALLVHLLRSAGVQKGDTIALGCSGSFPGLLLASLSAAKSLDVNCRTIISLGSSSYGANRPGLTILDIYNLILTRGIITEMPVAVSLGGEGDSGLGWEQETIELLKSRIEGSGYLFINENDLNRNVILRDSLYGTIKAFINAGGAMANIGTSESILGLKPGLLTRYKIPPEDQQGMIHKALLKGIPVIHLLNIKGLAVEYGLKWDPVTVGE